MNGMMLPTKDNEILGDNGLPFLSLVTLSLRCSSQQVIFHSQNYDSLKNMGQTKTYKQGYVIAVFELVCLEAKRVFMDY